MPSTIPYDPSLVLMEIVDQTVLDNLKKMSETQAPADAAEEHLNALMTTRRSLDMTKAELANLSIDTESVDDELKNVNNDLALAAKQYAQEKIKVERGLVELRMNLNKVSNQVESPVDYVKTQIKSMPISSNSVTFISKSTSWMGTKASAAATGNAVAQGNTQKEEKSLAGTLVFSVSCTHKNANMLAPFVLNVDKGIKVWNHLFEESDKLDPTKIDEIRKIARGQTAVNKEHKFSIISGVTFGSSFVGMVHVLNTSTTKAVENLFATATSLQAQMNAGSWFENASGGFGVNASIANDVKNLLSTQNISSHVTFTCMGVIPTVVANEVQLGVKQFANFDPKANMEAIATIQNATNSDQDSVKQSAEAARTGGQMQSMRSSEVKSALSALAEIDDGKNKILDINSLMGALDDYLKQAAEGENGVPLNYYLKDITKDMLAEMWVAKYYPEQYLSISHDDSERSQAGGAGGAAGGAARA